MIPAIITIVFLLQLASTAPTSRPATRPEEGQSEGAGKFLVRASPELRDKLVAMIGSNPIDRADIRAGMIGLKGHLYMDTITDTRGLAGYDAQGRVNSGFLLSLSEEEAKGTLELQQPNQVRLVGTLRIYVPHKAVAVDYVIDGFPVGEVPDEYHSMPMRGSVTWSNLREIPYDEGVWKRSLEGNKPTP